MNQQCLSDTLRAVSNIETTQTTLSKTTTPPHDLASADNDASADNPGNYYNLDLKEDRFKLEKYSSSEAVKFNDLRNRVATVDADCKFGVNRHSGSGFCYVP